MKQLLAISITCLCALTAQSQYSMQGDGIEIGDNCYQLTDAIPNEVSSIWYEELLDLSLPFELQFKMNFGSYSDQSLGPNNNSGADGMMFVLQNQSSTALGGSGQGMGYGSMTPSLGIEFDTYYNGSLGDMYPDHIGIHLNGNTNHNSPNCLSGPIQANSNNVNIEDGEDYAISITWDPQEQLVSVYFECEFRTSATVDLINDVFGGESMVWWGFTASTGGLSNIQTVCLYENVSPSGDIDICPGFSTQLVAGGDINSEFSWEPIDYLSDPNSFNPIATPPTSMVYTVTYTDFCGAPQSNTIEVGVEPIQVQIFPSTPELNCLEDEMTLHAYTNYENAVLEWEIINGEAISIEGGELVTNEAGVYVITSTSYDGNCSAEDSFEVIVDTTSYSAIIAPVGTVNCYTPSIIIEGSSNGDNAEFSWSTTDGQFFGSSSTDTPTVISGGTYNLEVTNPDNGCTSSNSVTVNEDLTIPEIELGYPSNIISCDFPVVQIEGTIISPEGYTELIEWSWNEGGLTNPFILEPFAPLPGAYSLTVTFEENGCTASTDSVYVEQDEYAFIDVSSMVIPNIFTPNGDAFNAKFRPTFTDPQYLDVNPLYVLDEYFLTVRNRWGHVVYQNNGSPIAWDGYSNGNPLSSGTYLVSVAYKSICGEVQEGQLDGVVNIIYD